MRIKINLLGRVITALPLSIGLMVMPAKAAGVSKVKLFTVADSALGGYTAAECTGRFTDFRFFSLSPSTSATQEFFAVNDCTALPVPYAFGTTPTQRTVLPPPIVITRLNAAGAAMSTDLLPAPAQLSQSNCNMLNGPSRNACPTLSHDYYVTAGNTGRVLVQTMKPVYYASTNTFFWSHFSYVFDPTAVTPADRWALISTNNTTDDESNYSGVDWYESHSQLFSADTNYASQVKAGFSPLVTKTYIFDRSVRGQTTVYELKNK